MTTTILISVIGVLSAIIVSLIGAYLANKNSIKLQIRKLKEDHYISYIESLHNLAGDNKSEQFMKNYVCARDKLLLIASENVIKKIFTYELEGVGKTNSLHDQYLTELIKSIRIDLKLKDKNFPQICFKKWD